MALPGNVALLLRSAWRYWCRHIGQALLLIVGMAIGVAVVFAVDIANNSARRAMSMSLDAVTGRTTHQIRASAGVDENIYTRLRVEAGLRSIAPVVTDQVEMRGELFELMGVDLFAESAVRDQFTGGDGAGGRSLLQLLNPYTVLLSSRTARRLDLSRGDSITVQYQGRRSELEIIGLLGGAQQAAMDNLLFVDIATAQNMFDMAGQLSRIDLVIASDRQQQQIESLLPGVTLVDALRRNRSVTQMTSAFHTNLQAMSLLALLVGGFLIYNTVTLSVLQRRRLFGLLRVAGVTRRELFSTILLEVLCFATIAVLIGLLAGYVIGGTLLTLIARTINDLYYSLGVQQVQFDSLVVLRAVALGFAAALIASLAPAVEAAGSPPATVLRRSALEGKTARLVSLLFVVGLLLLLLGAVATGLSQRSLLAGFSALFIVVLGFTLLIPALLRAVGGWSARRSGTSGRALGQYPLRSMTANLSRSSVAIASLAVAVSATAGVGIMIGSFRTSVANWLDATLEADIYISDAGAAANGSGFSPSILQPLRDIDGVAQVSEARATRVDTDRQPVRLLAVAAHLDAMRRFDIKAGDPAGFQQQLIEQPSIMVSEPLSWKLNLNPGDDLLVTTEQGVRAFEVVAVFTDYGTGPGTIVMDLQQYRRHWSDSQLSSIGVYLDDAASPDAVMEALRALVGEQQVAATIRATGEIKTASLQIFDRTFAVTEVLRWLTVLVAFIGILSALMAQMLERGQEFRTLHALGVTRAELHWLVIWQTAIMGALAGILALPLGYVMSRLLVEVINRRSFGWTMHFEVPPSVLIETVLLAVVAAVVAGCYPAWRLASSRRASLAGGQ